MTHYTESERAQRYDTLMNTAMSDWTDVDYYDYYLLTGRWQCRTYVCIRPECVTISWKVL